MSDLTGQRFGRLTVIEKSTQKSGHTYMWRCQCDCGNEKLALPGDLRRGGANKSCGCLLYTDISGQRFGRLTVLERTNQKKGKSNLWRCQCDCGNEKFALAKALKSGDVKSCGCIQKERSNESLVGQRFGTLTVVERTEERSGNNPLWRCLCDCGNEKLTTASCLKNGVTSHCGCNPAARPSADLTNQSFGLLTAIEKTDQKQGGSYLWRCRCQCGGNRLVAVKDLRAGKIKDCGCVQAQKRKELEIENAQLIGQRFGRLVVLEETEQRSKEHFLWRCHCDCGNEKLVTKSHLLAGSVKSCGCLRSDLSSANLTGQRFGRLRVIERTDRKEKKSYVWRCQCDCGKEVFVRTVYLTSPGVKSCGCFQRESAKKSAVMMFEKNMVDGTNQGVIRQAYLYSTPCANNTSGVRGVTWNKRAQRWHATIGFQGKTIYLGIYIKIEDAQQARKAAEEKYFGEYLRTKGLIED